MATSNSATAAQFAQYTLAYTATDADAGKILGIEFDSAAGGIPVYDSFALSVTHPFVHPGLAHSRTDLERMKNNINVEPYKTAYASYASSGLSQYTNTGQGPFAYETYAHGQFEIRNDAQVAHQNAVMWYVTGDTRYRDNAIHIMMMWANTLTRFDNSDYLTAATAIKDFCNAGEILRATGGGVWPARDITKFQNWMLTYLYPGLMSDTTPGAGSVLQAAGAGGLQMKGLLALGIFCDRPDLYSFGVASYRHNNHYTYGLLEYIHPSGQNYENQRDVGHASGNIGTFAESAYMVWNQGQDLFGLSDNLLAKAFESQAKFDMGWDVAPIPWTAADGSFHSKMSGDNRSSRDNLQSELAYYIYHEIKGLEMPYTKMSADLKFPNCTSEGGLYYLVDSSGRLPTPPLVGAPAPTGVMLYEDYLSGSYLTNIQPGTYDHAALLAAGMQAYGSGPVSSMKVPVGWTVTAYSEDKCQGRSVTVVGTLQNRGIIDMAAPATNFNDLLYSMKVTPGDQPYPIFNGTYELANLNSGKVAESSGSSAANGASLYQAANIGAYNQLWKVQGVGHGQYVIENLDSSLAAMEVSGSSRNDGARVDQCAYTPEQDLAKGGTASASGDGGAGGEGAAQAFDGNIDTKWYDSGGGGKGWLQYQLAGATMVDGYTITSANDVQERDPSAWQFQGSNDGVTWTTLDTETAQVFPNRAQLQTYSFTNTTSYSRYRLNVTANYGGTGYGVQLSKLGLYSSKSGALNQRWSFDPVLGSSPGSYFNIVNANSGLLLDVSGASKRDGAALIQRPGNNRLSQRWSLQVPAPAR